jgi:aspartate/glutamate racemase
MHKKIGIIGGLTPESTVSYYLYITRSYVNKFNDYGYPEIIIYLGCTEIPLLIKQEYCSVPVFDTASLHAEYALTKALENINNED